MTTASRLRFVGGAAILLGTVGVAAFYGAGDREGRPAPADTARTGPERTIRSAPAPMRSAAPLSAAPVEDAASRAAPALPPARAAEPPRFDVVRMGARGTAVVAGRAAPGAEVALMEGGREIGRARADARGEWVILPSEPLGAGARELSLRARLPGGEAVEGVDTVLVVGPVPDGPTMAQAVDPRPGAPRGAAAGPVREDPLREAAVPGRMGEAADQPLVLLLPPTLLSPTGGAGPRPLQGAAQGPEAPLGLDVVDYDDTDTMRFAGTAPPGARLRVYADGRLLGDAAADPAGRWSLVPAEPPAVGRHTLRVERIDPAAAGGVGTGRIEVAFQREALPAGAVRDGQVVVQPGHNLWRIARDAYGRGIRYTVIYRANQAQIRSPGRIFPGQVFAVPETR